jgi:hypothetical protein
VAGTVQYYLFPIPPELETELVLVESHCIVVLYWKEDRREGGPPGERKDHTLVYFAMMRIAAKSITVQFIIILHTCRFGNGIDRNNFEQP